MFLPNSPTVAALVLLSMSTIALAYTLIEKPWSDPNSHILAVFNESAFFVIFLCSLSVSTFSDKSNSESFGNLLICLVTLSIFVNLSAILYESLQFSKLLLEKYQNRKVKITPIDEKSVEIKKNSIEVIPDKNMGDLELQPIPVNYEKEPRVNPKKLVKASTAEPEEINPEFADFLYDGQIQEEKSKGAEVSFMLQQISIMEEP